MSHPLRAAHKFLIILSLIVKRMLYNLVAKNKLQIARGDCCNALSNQFCKCSLYKAGSCSQINLTHVHVNQLQMCACYLHYFSPYTVGL